MLQPRKTPKKKLTPQEELKMKNNQQGFSPWGYTPIQTERQDVLKPTEKKPKLYGKMASMDKKIAEKMSGAAMTIKDKLNKAVERAQAGRSSKLYAKATKAKEQGEMKRAGKLMKKFERGVRRRMN